MQQGREATSGALSVSGCLMTEDVLFKRFASSGQRQHISAFCCMYFCFAAHACLATDFVDITIASFSASFSIFYD